MILLTVIAVGLLTLSSISLRSSGQSSAMSVVRANARMALLLAIGELQKTTGPDKAITAPSEIVAVSPAKPNLTGVWDSWNFDVRSSSLDYVGPKTQASSSTSPGFKRWLVSDGSATLPAGSAKQTFSNSSNPPPPLDGDPKSFPWGESKAVNLTPVDFALEVGDQKVLLPGGKITAVPKVTQVDEYNRAQTNFYYKQADQ